MSGVGRGLCVMLGPGHLLQREDERLVRLAGGLVQAHLTGPVRRQVDLGRMRVEISLLVARRRDNKLRVQQAAIAGGSAARRSDWHDHFVSDGAHYLDELLFETEMNRGACGMYRRAGQLSFDVEAWE